MEQKPSIFETWKFFSLGTIIGFIIFYFYLEETFQNTSFSKPFELLNLSSNITMPLNKPTQLALIDIKKFTNETNKKCNMFDGRWVYRPEELPKYNTFECPFVEEKMSCKDNGRPDNEYEKWKWEARECDIPLFNGTYMLERLRNKRMILVGDSLNRNMWESLACLLYSSIPSTLDNVVEKRGYKTLWKAKEYNFTLEFFWSPFLIEINSNHESGKKVLVLDKLSADSNKWIGADIMVFNSGQWWDQRGRFKAWDSFEFEGKLTKDMPIEQAYEHGLQTWATWVEKNVNPTKTTVFFRSISTTHKFPQYDQWCYNKTQMIMNDSYVPVFPKSMINVVESVLNGMRKSQVNYLNITKLSENRIDAHPSMYRFKDWSTLTKKYNNNLGNYADCTHWCLPGVPDTWNRLLYASLFFDIYSETPTS